MESLEALLGRLEGKTLEFKRELSGPDSFLKSVVAFANTAGGDLLFGVEDGTRNVVGVKDPLELEQRVANLISDSIKPRVAPDIEILPWRNTHVVVVRVHPSSTRPHYVAALGLEQGSFIRVGSTNRRADRTMLDELRRLARAESYDEQPMLDLDGEALDLRAASELFEPVRKLGQRDLRVLELTVEHQGKVRPSIGGILLFGKERQRLFPDAYVQCGRFAGTDRNRIIDSVDIKSLLPRAIDDVLEFVRRYEIREIAIEKARNEERWSVPQVAVRETLINAVVHADYSQRGAPIRVSLFDDRLEIENPGLLPFGLTLDDIHLGVSKVRNRVIARVFKELGLIEQWGSGIGRVVSACKEAKLPAPRYEEIGWHFRVTLSKETVARAASDAVEKAILALLSDGRGRSTAEIAGAVNRSPRTARTRLINLVERGLVVEIGSSPSDPQRTYRLAQAS